MATKRAQAINGDQVTIEHPSADLSLPYSSFANVRFNSTVHFAQSFAPSAREYVAVGDLVGSYTVAAAELQVFQRTDIADVGETVVQYRGVWSTGDGILVVASYESPEHLVALVEALNPRATPLGVVIDPRPPASFVSHASVAVHLPDFATLEAAPLTDEVLATVPPWEGSATDSGELFAATISGDANYVVHVSETARTNTIPAETASDDDVARLAADLDVEWQT